MNNGEYYGGVSHEAPHKEETTVVNQAPTNAYDVIKSGIDTAGIVTIVLGLCYGLYKLCIMSTNSDGDLHE